MRVEPISWDGFKLKVLFRPIAVIEAEKTMAVDFTIEDEDPEGKSSLWPDTGSIIAFIERNRLPKEFGLNAVFQDLSGKQYESQFLAVCSGLFDELTGQLSITFQGCRG